MTSPSWTMCIQDNVHPAHFTLACVFGDCRQLLEHHPGSNAAEYAVSLSCLTLQLASGDSDGSFSTLSYSCCNCPTHMAASGTKALNSRHTKLAMQTQGLHRSREPQWLQPEVMACSMMVLLQLPELGIATADFHSMCRLP